MGKSAFSCIWKTRQDMMSPQNCSCNFRLQHLEPLLFAPQATPLAQHWVADFKRNPDKLTLRVTEQAGKVI